MKFWPLEPEKPRPAAQSSTETRAAEFGLAQKLFGETAAVSKNQRRDIVLWDMGGQEEYRLIHQLFLHDTTVALVLLDPTRGATAFKEVEAWNKSLEKQLRGRTPVKLLVGAKVDRPSEMIDRQALERLCQECGFVDYCETSAVTGRGVAELCEAVANAIDWDGLSKTTRPELFQAIRDEIEDCRKKGLVVVLFDDLDRELHTNEESPTFFLMQHEVAMASDAEAGTRALDAVCNQLAQQGMIARAKTSGGKSALVLRIEEVERYAGSLILAARNNPRGVPALELQAIAQEGFKLPGIVARERLPREEEKPVVECTVQLMLEHGICFQHEGLLVFPSLFAPVPKMTDAKFPHAVSLFYDFAGAIDNIYASLVAWLVLAKEFGKVRLWADRAEFEVQDGGLCGLRKVARSGGFAHVDVYFEAETPEPRRNEFISFVEDHLSRSGVEIREHVAITCDCGHEFAEETLRQRIARGDKDVLCPVCETRHSLSEGAAVARERDAKIAQHTWALRTQIEKLREELTKKVVREFAHAEQAKPATGRLHLLHLSDLHFTNDTPVAARLQWLLDDLKQDSGLGFKELDYLVISGDFTNKGCTVGSEKGYEFVSKLTHEFGLSAERCVFVPGNHDVCDMREAYDWRDKRDGLGNGDWVQQGEIFLARNVEKYPLRLRPFSDSFYHKFLQRPYPLDCTAQGVAIPFWETGIQFLALNSCWQIDQFHRKRSGIHVEAVAHAIRQAQKQENDARRAGQLPAGKPLLRIAVWHHAVAGPEQMKDTEFLGNLQKNGVNLALHGDVHQMQREQVGYQREKIIHVVGSGSFGACADDRPESVPRLYNVLEIARDLKSARVHTRCQPKPDGPWDGWYEWPDPDGGKGRVPFYDIKW
jgi:GTPase SAR1 family protein